MGRREGVERGRHVPSPHRMKEVLQDKGEAERQAKQAAEWIQREQKKDAKKD